MPRYIYSTIKKGTVKVTSPVQHRFLHAHDMPHTHVYSHNIRKRWP